MTFFLTATNGSPASGPCRLRSRCATGCGFLRRRMRTPGADGRALRPIPAQMPLCSSSYAPGEVIPARQASFARLPLHDVESLWHWHTEEAAPSACTTRMLRPDAQTWGISRITVGPERIDWLYREEMPGLAGPPVEHFSHLPLVSR